MSMCFAINTPEGVYIAGDGRIKFGDEVNSKIYKDDYEKIKPLTKKSALFVSGIYPEAEIIMSEVQSKVSDSSSLEDICSYITKACLKQVSKDKGNYNQIICMLAYNSGIPTSIEFASSMDFKPNINNKVLTTYNISMTKELSDEVASKISEFQINTYKDIINMIFDLFTYANRRNDNIGGLIKLYGVGVSKVILIEERTI